MAKPIGTIGNIPTITVGGRVFTDLTNLIQLMNYVNDTSYATFRAPNGTAGYAVTASTTLQVKAVIVHPGSTGAPSISLGYGDNDVGIGSGAAPTNAVWNAGSKDIMAVTGRGNTGSVGSQGAVANFNIPAGKYPACYSSLGVVHAHIFGYEV